MNLFCDFSVTPTGGGKFLHVCRRDGCGKQWIGPTDKYRTSCNIKSGLSLPCVRRGPEVRQQLCPSCCGQKTMIKVYACSAYGECELAGKLPGVALCGDHCPSYAAANPST